MPKHLVSCVSSLVVCFVVCGAALFAGCPGTIDDLVDFIVARVLDHLQVEHTLGRRWGGDEARDG